MYEPMVESACTCMHAYEQNCTRFKSGKYINFNFFFQSTFVIGIRYKQHHTIFFYLGPGIGPPGPISTIECVDFCKKEAQLHASKYFSFDFYSNDDDDKNFIT